MTSHNDLANEQLTLFKQREAKTEQRGMLDHEIHCITQRLIALRAAEEGYMLASHPPANEVAP